MLAMATGGGQADGEIAVLDFAVGRDGRLAQAPTDLVLAPLDTSGLPSGPPDALLARAATCSRRSPRRAAGRRRPDRRDPGPGHPGSHREPVGLRLRSTSARCRHAPPCYSSYALAPGLRPAPWRPPCERPDAEQPLRTAAAGLGALQAQLAPLLADLCLLETEIGGGASLRMPVIHIDPNGLTLAGGVLVFAATPVTPLLFDSALGRVSLTSRARTASSL